MKSTGGREDNSVIGSIKSIKREFKHQSEIKNSNKELETRQERLEKDKKVYIDRCFILEHYEEEIGRRINIIRTNQQDLEDLKPELSASQATLATETAAVLAAKADLDNDLKPYEALRDESQQRIDELKQSLSSIEYDIRTTPSDDLQTLNTLEARRDEITRVLDQEFERLDSYQQSMGEIERQHDGILAPLLAAEAATAAIVSNLQSSVFQAEHEIYIAKSRIEYCEHVKQHPEETDQLKERIEEDARAVLRLQGELEKMESQLVEIRAQTKKGKIALWIVAGILLVVVVVAIIIANTFSSAGSAVGNSTASSVNEKSARFEVRFKSVDVNDAFKIDVPDFIYSVSKDEQNADGNNLSTTIYQSSQPDFVIRFIVFSDMSFSSLDESSLLESYHNILEGYGKQSGSAPTINEGSFRKGEVVGSTMLIPEDRSTNPITSSESLLFSRDNSTYMISYFWLADNKEGLSWADRSIDSIELTLTSTPSSSSADNSASTPLS